MTNFSSIEDTNKLTRIKELVNALMDEQIILIPSFEDGVFGGYNIKSFTGKEVGIRSMAETMQEVITGQYGDVQGVFELTKSLVNVNGFQSSKTVEYDKLLHSLQIVSLISSLYEDKSLHEFTKTMGTVVADAKSGLFFKELFSSNPGARKSNAVETITYFMKNPLTGLIKIGKTGSVQKRKKALETASGCELELLATISEDVENDLHKRFKHIRVHGEWFSPGKDLLEYINSLP